MPAGASVALVAGRLVPEAVTYEGLRMARFEVTRAQFAAFDPAYRFEAATGDYPASGITFDRARAYAAWLSKVTGEAWRLPGLAEVKDLAEDPGEDDNTLDRWAGYAPSPEDAQRVREKAAHLGAGALLAEAGRSSGKGEEPHVHDLGGNVAEWAVGGDGNGVLVGGSADQPRGARDATALAGDAYRGFRVVSGEVRKKKK